jgi:Chaperone of endosialidase
VRAAGVALTSDVRFKRDIEPIENALDKILNIRGVSYNWRTDEFPQKHFNDRHRIGVIAQGVETQFPEVVDTNKNGVKSVNYPALVAPVIEAIKTLYWTAGGWVLKMRRPTVVVSIPELIVITVPSNSIGINFRDPFSRVNIPLLEWFFPVYLLTITESGTLYPSLLKRPPGISHLVLGSGQQILFRQGGLADLVAQ